MNNTTTQHIQWIDGLKGLCILIVVLHHIVLAVSGLEGFSAFPPFARLFFNGNFAVNIFIILSAMLTCYGLERRRGDRLGAYTAILSKRYFRLFYPVALIMLVMKLSNVTGLSYANAYGTLTHNGWLLNASDDSWKNVLVGMLISPLGLGGPILNVSWMLGYVFFGTLLIVAIDIIMCEKSRTGKALIYGLLLLLCYRYDPYYVNVVAAHIFWRFRHIGGVIARR